VAGRRRVTSFADVYYLTNTNKGESRSLTLGVQRPMKNNWAAALSWTRSKSTEVSPMTSSVAGSNYQNRAVFNPNEDVASRSNTDIPNRIVASYTRKFEFVKDWPLTTAFIYQARTGHAYSWVFYGDANGDGFAFNDLLYVPTGPNDPMVTWANTSERDAFFAFVNSNTLQKYAGRNAPRNSEDSPWNQTLDVRLTQEIPIWNRVKTDLYVNIINFGNLIDDSWGLTEEVPFSYRRAVAGTTYNPAGNGGKGSWGYTFTGTTLNGVPVVANDFPISRWQVQVGMRVRF
jgi:hypothetical protein